MFFEVDKTKQAPVLNSTWELNPELRHFFSKYVYPLGYLGNHKDKVNPWRHVAVRQKHFAKAAFRVDCLALDLEWLSSFPETHKRGNPVALHDLSHGYQEAFKNCNW